jgi:hypothetical protein
MSTNAGETSTGVRLPTQEVANTKTKQERNNENNAVYRAKHRELLKARARQYYAENKEQIIARNRERRHETKVDERSMTAAQYRAIIKWRGANRTKMLTYNRSYYERNKDTIRAKRREAYKAKKRAQNLNAEIPAFTTQTAQPLCTGTEGYQQQTEVQSA